MNLLARMLLKCHGSHIHKCINIDLPKEVHSQCPLEYLLLGIRYGSFPSKPSHGMFAPISAQLWLLCSQIVNKTCTTWRKAVRTIWTLFPMKHCDVISCISLEVSLQLRICKFSTGILTYGLHVVKTVAK